MTAPAVAPPVEAPSTYNELTTLICTALSASRDAQHTHDYTVTDDANDALFRKCCQIADRHDTYRKALEEIAGNTRRDNVRGREIARKALGQ